MCCHMDDLRLVSRDRRVASIFRGGGGGGCVLKMEIQTTRGVRVYSPGKILETLKCLRLHFARFHGGEKEKDDVE